MRRKKNVYQNTDLRVNTEKASQGANKGKSFKGFGDGEENLR